jgi:copper chaperone CopZ
MEKITLKITGMMCGMCEAHVNDAVRQELSVKKVRSSHTKGQTVIVTENEIDEEKLKEVIGKTGYELISIEREPYKKKGFLPWKK